MKKNSLATTPVIVQCLHLGKKTTITIPPSEVSVIIKLPKECAEKLTLQTGAK